MDSGYNISDAYVATQLREEVYLLSRALASTQIENDALKKERNEWGAQLLEELAKKIPIKNDYDPAPYLTSKAAELRK